jgi:DNA integrity scanning protein DisA with diadenylate cyclase activity
MSKLTIDQFMFPYQRSFRGGFQILIESVLSKIGATVTARVLVVGARAPGADASHDVCIEPEDGEWSTEPFGTLLSNIETTVRQHPMQSMYYSDEPSMRDKPENIRRNSVTQVVQTVLDSSDKGNDLRSFCALSVRVGAYYVVPIIQLPEEIFRQFPPLDLPKPDARQVPRCVPSFLHAAIGRVLRDATTELQRPEPGRSMFFPTSDRAQELARSAASDFMRTPAYATAGRYVPAELFERFNMISSLMYEGAHGVGQLILSDPEAADIDFIIRFEQPVPFHEPRWARKVLEMASAEVALISDSEWIYGLGKRRRLQGTQKLVFTIDFLDHYSWRVRAGEQVMLVARYGVATLPQEPIGRERFIENLHRVFRDSSTSARENLWDVFCAAVDAKHGSMIVVAADAKEEMQRLAAQGTALKPMLLTADVFRRVSGIDGAVVVDPEGLCHAVGVILDGVATSDCTPARGSRFNSAVRYVSGAVHPRLAIVVSEDRTVDVFPLLRPRICRQELEANVLALERATSQNLHKPRNWLDNHRFYLSEQQCLRANRALDRIKAEPKEVGQIWILTKPFETHSEMSDDYFSD